MDGFSTRPARRSRRVVATFGALAMFVCVLALFACVHATDAAVTTSATINPTAPAPVVERLAGPTRVQTAIAISQRSFASAAPVVVIATGDAFPDALTGGPLAHVVGGPLLLVRGGALGSDVAAEITRLSPARAFVLGGHGAVPEGIDAELSRLGVAEVIRLGGAT